MISKLKRLLLFLRIVRRGEFLGDAIILKSTLGKFEPSDRIATMVATRSSIAPDFTHIDFESMPPGSFGRAYFDFMKANNLKRFAFSGKYRDLMQQNYLPIYYGCVHDFIHVLTGYDASPVGEAGVWGFVLGQDISPQARRAVTMAKILFPLLRPSQFAAIQYAAEEGYSNGRKADLILFIDFETEFVGNLDQVRQKFNVIPTRSPGVASEPKSAR